MKTAMQWLIEQTKTPEWHSLKRGDILETAKEKEKQQIITAFEDGINCLLSGATGNEYFNITFKDNPNETIQRSVEISDKFAIDFHIWCKDNAIKYMLLGSIKSYDELLEIYKETL